MLRLCVSNPRTIELGLLFIRVSVGLMFVLHGWGKFFGGPNSWQWLGAQMSNLGITFLPVVWGFLAAATELFGGLCLIFGIGTRLVSLLLSVVMFVAVVYHLKKGDAFMDYSHALTLLLIFIGLFLAGPGSYSLDQYLHDMQDGKKGVV